MKVLAGVLLTVLAANAGLVPRDAADCVSDQCTAPDCRCFQVGVPGGLDPKTIPQVVMITFDDAVNAINYESYYSDALANRQNPNGCPISASFFVSHEYTDYTKVNKLYSEGHEIALHSISHKTQGDYWTGASVDLLKQELADQRITVSNFANIPAETIRGIRMPFLQLAGDNTFQMMTENDFEYDCSWPTQTYVGNGLFPYTLDFKSRQDCNIGVCPTESHPGAWVVPMVDWKGINGAPCAMVDTCAVPSGVDPLLEFMKTNFHRHYDGYREPFGFFVHAAWFQANSTNYEGFKLFLDYLGTLNDVYMVTIQQALKWTKNPVPTSGAGETFACSPITPPECANKSCQLQKPGEGERYMGSCVTCPKNYPWLGNPLGE